MRGLKPDPSQLSVATLIGDDRPFVVEDRASPGGGPAVHALANSCGVNGGTGPQVTNPAVRLAEFSRSFAGRGTRASICATDYAPALREAARLLKHPLGAVCVDSSHLADSSTESGIQPACKVDEIRALVEAPISACPLADDCIEIVPDPAACPETSDHLRLVVHRTSTPEPLAYLRARCEAAGL